MILFPQPAAAASHRGAFTVSVPDPRVQTSAGPASGQSGRQITVSNPGQQSAQRNAAAQAPGRRKAAPSTPRRSESPILVSRIAGSRTRGKLILGPQVIPCVLGLSGTIRAKREGDGATPIGTWGLVAVRWRGDKLARTRTGLPHRTMRPDDGWCDDPRSSLYNRSIRLPCRARHEELWRADGLYDVVVILDYNLRHPARDRGSAIFFHLTAPDRRPTAGCVAIDRAAMLRLLPRLRPGSRLKVLG